MKVDQEKAVKARLISLRDDLLALSDAAKDNRKPVALDQQSVGRLSRMDSLQVQAMDMAQEETRKKRVLRINAALKRLEEGDYGYCVQCDESIAPKRLEIDPATPLCIRCAQ